MAIERAGVAVGTRRVAHVRGRDGVAMRGGRAITIITITNVILFLKFPDYLQTALILLIQIAEMRGSATYPLNVLTALSLLLAGVILAMWLRSYWSVDAVLKVDPERSIVLESASGHLALEDSWQSSLMVDPVPGPYGLRFEGKRGKPSWSSDLFWKYDPNRRSPNWLARLGIGWSANGEHWPKDFLKSFPGQPPAAWTAQTIVLPDWLLFAFAAVLPASGLTRRIRQRRLRRGNACPTCRYNLTANVSGICPECGCPVTGHTLTR